MIFRQWKMEFAFLIPYKLFCKFIKIFKLVICASRKGIDEGPFDLKIYMFLANFVKAGKVYLQSFQCFKKIAWQIYFFVLLWLTLCITTYINHLHILFFRQQLKDKMQENSDFDKDEVCMFPILKKYSEKLCSWKLLLWY